MNETLRNRTAVCDADLEPDPGDASLGAEEVAGFRSPVRLRFDHYRKRLVDPDGLSVKYAIDGLVHAGILADDSPQQIAEISHRQIKSRIEKTVIIIEAIE